MTYCARKVSSAVDPSAAAVRTETAKPPSIGSTASTSVRVFTFRLAAFASSDR